MGYIIALNYNFVQRGFFERLYFYELPFVFQHFRKYHIFCPSRMPLTQRGMKNFWR